jgi:hypothetical protein
MIEINLKKVTEDFILHLFLCSLITKTEIRLSPPPIENINTNNLSSIKIPLHRLYRSKSLINNKEEINKHISRSYSLPSINIEEANMLKFQSNIKKSIDLNNDNYSMPMIVNIEENVQIDNQKIESKIHLISNKFKRKNKF